MRAFPQFNELPADVQEAFKQNVDYSGTPVSQLLIDLRSALKHLEQCGDTDAISPLRMTLSHTSILPRVSQLDSKLWTWVQEQTLLAVKNSDQVLPLAMGLAMYTSRAWTGQNLLRNLISLVGLMLLTTRMTEAGLALMRGTETRELTVLSHDDEPITMEEELAQTQKAVRQETQSCQSKKSTADTDGESTEKSTKVKEPVQKRKPKAVQSKGAKPAAKPRGRKGAGKPVAAPKAKP